SRNFFPVFLPPIFLPAHPHRGIGCAICGHFFSKFQCASLSVSWHLKQNWSIWLTRRLRASSVSPGFAFQGFRRALSFSSKLFFTCRLPGPWQLSQPTCSRWGVAFSSVKPVRYSRPTTWQRTHSPSYWRSDGRVALTSVS